jgi:hypothetical protein
MDGFESGDCDSIDALLSADAWAREAAAGWCPVRAAS